MDVLPSSSEHPATWKFDYPIYHPADRAAWRAWLEANHPGAKGVWHASWKRHTDWPAIPYPETVREALCFGWIDSTADSLDDTRRLQLFTPRKPRSTWTRLNRRRVADLEAQGLMAEPGRRAVEVAQANGWWTIYDPVEDLEEPDDLRRALDAVPPARQAWDAFPPSARKNMLWWVISAAKADTRARRVAAIVEKAGNGERARG